MMPIPSNLPSRALNAFVREGAVQALDNHGRLSLLYRVIDAAQLLAAQR